MLTVTALQEQGGVITYEAEAASGDHHSVVEAELDAHIELNTPIERLLNNQLGKPRDFGLRMTTLEHAAAGAGFGLGGLLGPRTALLSHQLYVAANIGKRFAPRVLLADEVGLGKTIEAGLILTQQLHRQRVRRVLVLVPETLAHQWLVEMQRRFHLAFSLLNAERLEDADVEAEFSENALVIAPISLFEDDPMTREIVSGLGWDMVEIDEAHHITGIGEEPTDLGQFVCELSARARGLLLLTATPEQAGLRSHFDRLQLIDPARFADFDQFKAEHAQFAEWSSLIDQLEQGETVALPKGLTLRQIGMSRFNRCLTVTVPGACSTATRGEGYPDFRSDTGTLMHWPPPRFISMTPIHCIRRHCTRNRAGLNRTLGSSGWKSS